MTFTIETASRADLDRMVEWAAAEGWNPGLRDADSFFAADPQGFLVGRLDGQMVSCISAVRYGGEFGFIGFYITAPDYRGQGIGIQVWNAAIRHLGGRCIGLDGVVEQQANYAKSGFTLVQNNIRYGGVPAPQPVPRDILAYDDSQFDRVARYDSAFFAGPRRTFLHSWIHSPGSRSFIAGQDGLISGYGTIRKCREGYKIGPLFAEDPSLADRLFRALAATAPGETVYLDIPEPNRAARDLAERHGLTPCFQTARMYANRLPDLPMDRTYGITSFELG